MPLFEKSRKNRFLIIWTFAPLYCISDVVTHSSLRAAVGKPTKPLTIEGALLSTSYLHSSPKTEQFPDFSACIKVKPNWGGARKSIK